MARFCVRNRKSMWTIPATFAIGPLAKAGRKTEEQKKLRHDGSIRTMYSRTVPKTIKL